MSLIFATTRLILPFSSQIGIAVAMIFWPIFSPLVISSIMVIFLRALIAAQIEDSV